MFYEMISNRIEHVEHPREKIINTSSLWWNPHFTRFQKILLFPLNFDSEFSLTETRKDRMPREYDCILFQMGSQSCQNQNITDGMDNSF